MIKESKLPGKYKKSGAYSLITYLGWSLLIYEVALSRVEIIERKCSVCIRKWLILPHVKQLITVPGKRCLAAPTYFESLDIQAGKV